MGRYASIQAYADTNANMRKVPYEQAAGTSASSGDGQPRAAAKPEKVVNPYGSTAGAGSGEFHVYRHARAREMERMKRLDKEEQEELLEKDYQEKLQQYQQEAESKTAKNRKKRKRQKEAKLRKKNLKLAGVLDTSGGDTKVSVEEEFTYIPVNEQVKNSGDEEGANERVKDETEATTTTGTEATTTTDAPELPFANDGSFLEQMKKRFMHEKETKLREENGGDEDDDEEDSRPKKKQEF